MNTQEILLEYNQKSSEPFLIRGHHIPWFVQAVYWIPSKLAEQLTIKGTQQPSADTNEFDAWYAQDVFGPSLNPRPFLDHMTNRFQTFNALKPENPVHIIVAQVDEICNGCAIGRHCRVKYPRQIEEDVFDTVREDERYLEMFLKAAKQTGGNTLVTQDQVSFLGLPNPEVVRRVITDANTVRRAFKMSLVF